MQLTCKQTKPTAHTERIHLLLLKKLETNKFTSVFFPNLTNFCKLTNE